MSWILVALSLLYGGPILAFAIGHRRVIRASSKISTELRRCVVIIAARNEESVIEKCLKSVLAQSEVSEVIVVDDHSGDRTASIVAAMQADYSGRLRLEQLSDTSGKKAAIGMGIDSSTSEVLLLTDADTLVPPNWAKHMLSCFDENTGFVVGPVIFKNQSGLISKMMSLEWLGFMGIAAGAVGLGRPILCSGANLAYRRSAFEEVGGYSGIEHLSSGDDELLMHRVADQTHWRVRYCAHRDAIVETAGPESAAAFLEQRRRWASKGGSYERKWLIAMNFGFWIFFLALPVSLIASIWISALRIPVLVALFIKICPEFILLFQSARFFRQKNLLATLIPAQPLQVAYVIWAGAAGMKGNFEWKSRSLDR